MRARDFINEKRRKKKRNPATVLYYGYPWGYTGDSSGDSGGDGGGMSESSHDARWTNAVDRHTRMRALAKRQGDEEKFNYHHNELRKLFGKDIPVTPDSTFNDDPGGIKIDEIGVPPVSPSWPMPDKLPRKQPPFPDPKKKISEDLTPEDAQQLWIKNYGEEMAERVFYNIKEELLHTVSDLKSIRASACDTQDRLEAMSRVEFARWLLTYFTDALERYDWPEAHSEGIAQVIRDRVRQPLLNKQCLLEVSRVKISSGTPTPNLDNKSWTHSVGASIVDKGTPEKTVLLPVSKIDVHETDDKFNDPQYAKNLRKIVDALKAGKKLPPILVRRQGRRYQVIDGHHRFKAHRMLGLKSIPARIVEPFNIKDVTPKEVNENFADKKVKGKSRPGRVKRAGASCQGSVTSLRQKAAKYGGEKGKMYHWCANMKSGKKK